MYYPPDKFGDDNKSSGFRFRLLTHTHPHTHTHRTDKQPTPATTLG